MDAEAKAVSHEKDSSQCVRVAVNIRPLITPELLIGCTDCITVVPGEPQVQIGTHAFTFDSVYGNGGSQYSAIYSDCIAPLIDALFNGYNATVLAYGQTGSGKTFTMGTNYHGNANDTGIIPHVMENIFSRVKEMNNSAEFLIRVSFIEIFKEEVYDLLDQSSMTMSKMETSTHVKTTSGRVPIQIRETVTGGITLAGVTEAEVRSKEEMASYLSHGSLTRATASTNMNSQSSRSHAIFTISMEQKRLFHPQTGVADECMGDDILSAKLHLVDLAGSERVKRTKADGMRFKEGVHINKGLLALGNVISALGDEKRRKEGGHVPYRDSKLTRLLQDSLGGNSKTVMIACVSPADSNAEETLNTLKYANRARNIQNKAVINRDPVAGEMQRLRSLVEQLQSELIFFRGDASAEEIEILKKKNSLLEAKNTELQREVKERHITFEHLSRRAIDAQVEKDKLIMKVQALQNGKSLGETDSNLNEGVDLIKHYVTTIQELEAEVLQLQKMRYSNHSEYHQSLDSIENGFHINPLQSGMPDDFPPICDDLSDLGDIEVDEKEVEHSSIQENFDRELKELEKKLEQKEAEMKQFSNASTLKQIYEKKFFELEHEKKVYLKEIDELRHSLANISSASDDGAQKIKHDYLQKLNALESQLSELKKKQDAQSQQLRQKQKSDEAAKRLQDEIQRIKSQKVQLQHKMKHESEQFRLWKASREKELLQLKKEGRRNEFEMHKLLALNQRQKMVLQRKTEEASMATKRLKELLESRKSSSVAGNGPGIQALMQTIEHELEVTVRVHEVRSEYQHQLEERESMAKEVAELKEEASLVKQNKISRPELTSPGARNSRIFALENMLSTSSNTLVSMASQLSAAEERERLFSGKGRWNQVRSLAEAKNVMNYLFNVASSSRCQLRDKDAICREKDSEIKVQKEKTVQLGSLVRQLEMQMKEHKLLDASLKSNPKEHAYDLRKGRSSLICSVKEELMEDMDTSSDSDLSDEEWIDSAKACNGVSRDETAELTSKSSGLCCTCSKKSSCKTVKCKCRAIRDICWASCGCVASLCSNRDAVLGGGELEECGDSNNDNNGGEDLGTHALASHGAVLLQGAFFGRPENPGEDGRTARKALSDIGNASVKPNAGKPPRGKKPKKQEIIPVVVPATAQKEKPGDVEKEEESGAEMHMKLPRAMRSSVSNQNTQLRERNSDPSSKAGCQEKAMDGKENHEC